jgi:hypothetical protein
MAGRGHLGPTGMQHEGSQRQCKVPECAAVRRAVDRERKRNAKTGDAGTRPQAVAGTSGAAARAWLASRGIDPEAVPAAADLLLVSDALDAAKAGGQIQFVAALAGRTAALRGELVPRTAAADDEDAQEPTNDDSDAEPRRFDIGAI